MGTIEAVADEAVNIVAILALVAVATTSADHPTTVTGAIAGLGGYRMHRRSKSGTTAASPPK